MLEIKLTVEAPELANALNNLASAMGGVKAAPQQQPTASMAQPMPTQQFPIAPQPPVNYPIPTHQPAPMPQANPGVPLAQPPQYTTEQIMAAGAALVDGGRVNDLIALLNQFGVQAVTALKPEQLGAFATAMREIGANI